MESLRWGDLAAGNLRSLRAEWSAIWMDLKKKALPARSSRPSQGEGELHRKLCIGSACPYDSNPPTPVGWTDTTYGIAGWTKPQVLAARIFASI